MGLKGSVRHSLVYLVDCSLESHESGASLTQEPLAALLRMFYVGLERHESIHLRWPSAAVLVCH